MKATYSFLQQRDLLGVRTRLSLTAVALALSAQAARGDCFTNPCGSGCPNRCNPAICSLNALCDSACGGNPCNVGCICWSACPATRCNPVCGGNACASGCSSACDPIICPGSVCDTGCHPDANCNPLCGGNLCNPGCNDCNFFLCPQDLCDLNCRPTAACDPLCGGNPCAPNCQPTGCGCPANRCFNLEIDYMVDNDHSHKPNQAELDAVIQMFACQGWTLNIQVSDAIPHYDLIKADPITCLDIFHYIGEDASFGRMKQLYANHAFEPGWHYAIFAHDYQLKVGGNCINTGSSGLADSPGNNLIVTLGSFSNQTGTAFDRAATLAHEFGHNLGLSHCGDMDPGGPFGGSCANVGSYPPNLGSIMSYVYQLSGVRRGMLCNNFSFDEAVLFKEMDYSHGTMCDLNESALDEVFGTGMLGVDWNCDLSISGVVAHDLDQPPGAGSWCPSTGGLQTLSDFDEWGFIEAEHAVTATAGPRPSRQPTPCITADEVQQFVIAGGCTPPQPTLSTEACEDRDMIYMHPAGGGGASGRCSFPYQNLQNAHNAAADGSVMFFRAGSYPQPGRVLLTKPMKLFNQPAAGQSTTVITAP